MGCSENPWKTCPIKEGRDKGRGERRKREKRKKGVGRDIE